MMPVTLMPFFIFFSLSLWFDDYLNGFSTPGYQTETQFCLLQAQTVGDHLMYRQPTATDEIDSPLDIQRTCTIGGHKGDPIAPKLVDWNWEVQSRFRGGEEEHRSSTINGLQGLRKGGKGPSTDDDQISQPLIVDLTESGRHILFRMDDKVRTKTPGGIEPVCADVRGNDACGA
jgi:hypothetical protein